VREALYWLKLTHDAVLPDNADVIGLVREADELVAILTTSIKTAKEREASSCREASAPQRSTIEWNRE